MTSKTTSVYQEHIFWQKRPAIIARSFQKGRKKNKLALSKKQAQKMGNKQAEANKQNSQQQTKNSLQINGCKQRKIITWTEKKNLSSM